MNANSPRRPELAGRAFSLTELMVTLALIGVLAGAWFSASRYTSADATKRPSVL